MNTFYYSNINNNFKAVDLYYGLHSTEQSPLIVFIHGGAWRSEDKADYKQLCTDFCEAGYTVASVNYRLSLKENDMPPKVQHPSHINDVGECLTFLSSSPPIKDKYNPNRFYLVGHSAGAHIAMMLLLDSLYCKYIQGVLGVSGIYDIPLLVSTFPSYLDFIQQGFGIKESYEQDSPAYKTSNQLGTKPIIIAQSSQDSLIDNPQAQVMYEHLKKIEANVHINFDIQGDHFDIMNYRNLQQLVLEIINI